MSRTGNKHRETTKLVARYSGDDSGDVWELIEQMSEPEHSILYLAACALQDHEQRFLQMLASVVLQAKGER